MFPIIEHVDQLRQQVGHMPEIRFIQNDLGYTIVSYMIGDEHTFHSDNKHWARECRGITFDPNGKIVSRPFHKFFNLGECPDTQAHVLDWDNIVSVMDKRDGSMLHPVFIDGDYLLKSKKSFTSDVAKMATRYAKENPKYEKFMRAVQSFDATPIFEFTSPKARIVLAYQQPELKLLNVRYNVSGLYWKRDVIAHLANEYDIPCVDMYSIDEWETLLAGLEDATHIEGYVVQFADGNMVKAKAKWYLDLHHAVTFTTYRQVAEMVLSETVDDYKSFLSQTGASLNEVNKIEHQVKERLIQIEQAVEDIIRVDGALDRKTFAIKYQPICEHFGALMQRYSGKEPNYADYYLKNFLKAEFPPEQISQADD